MRNIDLAAELGAHDVRVLGRPRGHRDRRRQGRAGRARPLPRGRSTLLAQYSIDRGYGLRFALEPKPNEPRGDILLPTVGHALAFIDSLEHADMVGLNPEVGHEQMSNLNFVHAHRPGAVARQAVPHRPQRPARAQVRPGPGLRPRRPAQRVLPRRPAGERRPTAARYDGPRHFDYKPLRTEDIGRRLGLGGGEHAHLPAAQGAGGGVPGRPRGAGGARGVAGHELARADAGRRRDLRRPAGRPLGVRGLRRRRGRRPRLRLRPARPARASSTSSAPAERRSLVPLVAGVDSLDPVVQGRGPRRRDRRAGPRGPRRRTRTAPRSTRPRGGPRCSRRSTRGRRPRRRRRRRGGRPAARHGRASTTPARSSGPALLWNDTRSAAAGGATCRRAGRPGGVGRGRRLACPSPRSR